MKSIAREKKEKTDFFKKIKTKLTQFIEINLEIAIAIAVLLAILVVLFSFGISHLNKNTLWSNILGLSFNVLVFGVLIVMINKMVEKREIIKGIKKRLTIIEDGLNGKPPLE